MNEESVRFQHMAPEAVEGKCVTSLSSQLKKRYYCGIDFQFFFPTLVAQPTRGHTKNFSLKN